MYNVMLTSCAAGAEGPPCTIMGASGMFRVLCALQGGM